MIPGGNARKCVKKILISVPNPRSLSLFSLPAAARFPDRYLLHGDLHHENILFDEAGGWKVIDPKGVVDCKYLEIGRFIRNELWRMDGNYSGPAFSLMEILLSSFASAFHITSDVVSTAVCIDAAISNSWTLEGEMSESDFIEGMADAEKEIEFFLSYITLQYK